MSWRETIAVVVAAAIPVVASILLPGAPWPYIALMSVITVFMAWLTRRRFGDAGALTVLVAGTLISVGLIANIFYFTTVSGGTDAHPVLHNVDANRNWLDALWYMGEPDGQRAPYSHSFYAAFIAGVMMVTGRSVTAACMTGLPLILVTLYFVADTVRRLGMDRRTAVTAMAATASVCYLLAAGCILVKDAWMICSMTLAMNSLCSRHVRVTLFFIAAAMVGLARPNCEFMLIAGLAVPFFLAPRRDRSVYRLWYLILLAMVAFGFWMMMSQASRSPELADQLSGSVLNIPQNRQPQHYAFYGIFGDYATLPVYQKLLLLPATALVQYLVPFPWNFTRDVIFGYSNVYAHIAYPWYVFGALLVYYLVRGYRRGPRTLLILTLWGLFCWMVPAYIDGGTISRYGLPAVPVLAPAVAVVLTRSLRDRWLWIMLAIFAVGMAIGLPVCHHLQMAAM